ncbi:MAG: hypothetical protein ACE5OO_06735 [Candidatus Bathyarchaeia archaeon]
MEDQARGGSTATLELFGGLQDRGEAMEVKMEEMEPALSELFQSMHEGAQMLAEARVKDARLVGELCASLTAYTTWLGVTLELPPETIPKIYEAERLFLSPRGHLVVVDKEGRVNSRSLDEYPTEIVLNVVLKAMPQLRSAIHEYLQRLGERIDLLDRINSELRSLPTSVGEESR